MINKFRNWSYKLFSKRIWCTYISEAENIWRIKYMPNGYDCTTIEVKYNIFKMDYLYTFKVYKKC